jgi:hypothetical protein
MQRLAYTNFYKQLENLYIEVKMYIHEFCGRRIATESDYCAYAFYDSNLYHFKKIHLPSCSFTADTNRILVQVVAISAITVSLRYKSLFPSKR